MRIFIILYSSQKYYLHDQIKNNEIGGACIRHGRWGKCLQILVGNLKGKDLLEDQGANERITLRKILRI
jgi:hypothetical protein